MTLAEPKLRRIAMHPNKRYLGYVCRFRSEHPKLCSLFLFQHETVIDLDILECSNFKILRVLTIIAKYDDEWHVSSEIDSLHHLRYLKLYGRRMILPRAIGRLKSLHTLYIKYHAYISIPNVLSKLERLRHIVLHHIHIHKVWYSKEVHRQPSFFPKNIETLKHIVVDEKLIESKAVVGLSNLQILGMVFKREKDAKPILMLLRELQRLVSLNMEFERGSTTAYPDLEHLSQYHRLSKLMLEGELKEDPQQSYHVLEFLPPNIVKLTLSHTRMKHDPMGVSEKCHDCR
ncbi:hypothetical protein V6N13_038384 [Hibiscus sabdariffa]